MKKYGYLFLKADSEGHIDYSNGDQPPLIVPATTLGAQGWRIVGVINHSYAFESDAIVGGFVPVCTLIFEKEISDDGEGR